MKLFGNKNKYNMKAQLKKNIATNLSSCRTCRFFDEYRSICLNRNSGATYTSASQPRCNCWQLR